MRFVRHVFQAVAALALVGCASGPVTVMHQVPVLAQEPADPAAYATVLGECRGQARIRMAALSAQGGPTSNPGRPLEVGAGVAGAVGAVGAMGASAPAAVAGAVTTTTVVAGGVVAAPVVAGLVSARQRTEAERALRNETQACLDQRGYPVQGWERPPRG